MSDNGVVTEPRHQSPQHKLNTARTNIVKSYLTAVAEPPHLLPDRDERLAEVEERIRTVKDSIELLELLQSRLELTGQVEAVVPSQLLQQFLSIAADWAEANGISYAAFQSLGVPPVVLRAAGMAAKGTRLPSQVVYEQSLAVGRPGGSAHSTRPMISDVELQKRVARLLPDIPGQKAVGDEVGVSQHSVGRIIRILIKKGWVRQTLLAGSDDGRPGRRQYQYELLVDLDTIVEPDEPDDLNGASDDPDD